MHCRIRSTLDFTCGFQSVRFDPFTCVSLPLPEPDKIYLQLTVVFDDGARQPVRYSLELSDDAHVSDIKEELHKLSGCPPETLQLCEM